MSWYVVFMLGMVTGSQFVHSLQWLAERRDRQPSGKADPVAPNGGH